MRILAEVTMITGCSKSWANRVPQILPFSTAYQTSVPLYLAPRLTLSPSISRPFSTAPVSNKKGNPPDNNPNRGIAPLRRKSPSKPLLVTAFTRRHGLPKPVLDPLKRTQVQVDENHGLYGFFSDQRLLMPPKEEAAHGRNWTVQELRNKSWEDLQSLWYLCCKERNRLATEQDELKRLRLSKGRKEGKARDRTIRKTQRSIKWALTERWYAWEDAWRRAQKDPDIDLSARDTGRPIYSPTE